MNVIASTIVLAVALTASGQEARSAQINQTGPVRIDVMHTEQGNLYYYSLQTKSYQSQFKLHYYEYLNRPQPGQARTQFLVFDLPGSAGRQLTAAFVGLGVSWNSDDYYWFPLPEHFAELPEDDVPCGMIAFDAKQLLACPISTWASAGKSAQANNLAWFIQLLELTRYRFSESKRPAEPEESKEMLLGLLQKIEGGQQVQVGTDGPSAGRQIPVGIMLRTVVAQAMVNGGLFDTPMNRPESEIRQAAAEWYADRLPQEDARQALLHALRDKDSRVRAAAATALATDVARNDSTTIEALRGVLQREPDPFVRRVIRDLLDGRDLLNGAGAKRDVGPSRPSRE